MPSDDELLDLLEHGEVEVRGRIGDASNTTLYAECSRDGSRAACVYKPVSGERPLWDFPARTLARRETASFVVSAATGWRVVPPTVLRDGPLGPGSVQWWVGEPETLPEPGAGLVDVVPSERVRPRWLPVLDAEGMDGSPVVLAHADHPVLRRMALFDAVTNNTDRKGGHILRHASGAVFGVDHGLTFNLDDKLRTVLWGFAGEPLTEEEVEVVDKLGVDLLSGGDLAERMTDLLSGPEVERTARRAMALVRRGRFPRRPTGWGTIPWPPF